jgi:pyridoxine kinase
MNILSIQSHVAYGHAGNSAAVFALQRLGVEVWPVHTVQFSNHTGYDTFRGMALEADHVLDLLQGLGERGAFARCDGVLSGYIGSADMGFAVLNAMARAKRVNGKALYCCDPVLGDAGRGLFVKPDVADFMRARAVPAADVATPNHFELEQITGRQVRIVSEALAAIDSLRALGPSVVLVTSLRTEETPADAIDLVACDAAGRHRIRTPKLPVAAHGAGDLMAALFFAHYLRSRSAAEAMARATSSTFGILKHTADQGAEEMALIEAQDELTNPSVMFNAEPL